MEGAHTKKRKKGLQLRLDAEKDTGIHKSRLADFLLQQFAWGIFSAPQIQQIAEITQSDFELAGCSRATFPELEQLAAAGSHGRYTNNLHRDIAGRAMNRTKLKPFEVKLPFAKWGEQETEILLPHEQFSNLYYNFPNSFSKRFLPDPEVLPNFWESVKGHPFIDGFEIASPEKAIPLGLHGDELPITGVGKVWAKLALTLQFYSLMSQAIGVPTVELMFWIFCVCEWTTCMGG